MVLLKQAVAHGPIILLIATNSLCDTLIVILSGVEHVSLCSKLISISLLLLPPYILPPHTLNC